MHNAIEMLNAHQTGKMQRQNMQTAR